MGTCPSGLKQPKVVMTVPFPVPELVVMLIKDGVASTFTTNHSRIRQCCCFRSIETASQTAIREISAFQPVFSAGSIQPSFPSFMSISHRIFQLLL